MIYLLFLSFLDVKAPYYSFDYREDFIFFKQIVLPSLIPLSELELFKSNFNVVLRGYYTTIDSRDSGDVVGVEKGFMGFYFNAGYLYNWKNRLYLLPSIFYAMEGMEDDHGYGMGFIVKGGYFLRATDFIFSMRMLPVSKKFYTPFNFEAGVERKFPSISSGFITGYREEFFINPYIKFFISRFFFTTLSSHLSSNKISIGMNFNLVQNQISIFYGVEYNRELHFYHSIGFKYNLRRRVITEEEILYARIKSLAESFYQTGMRNVDRGKFQEGLDMIEKAIILDPDNEVYRVKFREIEERWKNRSIDSLKKVYSALLKEGDIIGGSRIAEILWSVYGIEEFGPKADSLSRIVKLKYENVGEEVSKGIKYLKRGDYSEALGCFLRVLTILPDDSLIIKYVDECNRGIKRQADSLYGVAERLFSYGNLVEAEKVLNRVLDIKSDHTEALELKKKIQKEKQKRVAILTGNIEKAIERNDIERARALLEELRTLVPNSHILKIYTRKLENLEIDPVKLHLEAATYYAKNDFETAIRIWKLLKKYYPGYPHVDENIKRAEKKIKMLEGK